ncbi:hypothetical protein SRHO_G00140420 [Serrasalmus rhombeus]
MPHGKGLRAGLRDATPAARIPASHLQHQQYVCVLSRTTVTCQVMPHQLAAELYAITRACILAQDQDVTIYTDSRYAFGVVHDFGGIWHQRGFVTTDNKPISHASLIEDLIRATFLPSRLAVVKVRAHQSSSDPDSVGNNTADSAAKHGALHGPPCPFMNSASFSCAALTVDLLPGLDLDCIQATASDSDIKHWLSSSYDPAVKPLRDIVFRPSFPIFMVFRIGNEEG